VTRPARPCSQPGCPALQPCLTHPPKQRWDNSTRTRRRTGTGWDEQARHKRILRRDGRRCYLCGGVANQVDHKVPLYLGGTDAETNLAAICDSCHDTKTAREGHEARRLRRE